MAQLPGFGPRSAQRAMLFALKNEGFFLDQLISNLESVRKNIKKCQICGNFSCSDICSVCLDPKRTKHQLCIIESVSDLWTIERANFFNGKFHILGGILSAIDGISPNQLNTETLLNRIENEGITEVIIALSATIEGQTTMYYIAELLSGKDINVFSLAQGIPIGGELNYLDDGTLSAAFLDKREVILSKKIA